MAHRRGELYASKHHGLIRARGQCVRDLRSRCCVVDLLFFLSPSLPPTPFSAHKFRRWSRVKYDFNVNAGPGKCSLVNTIKQRNIFICVRIERCLMRFNVRDKIFPFFFWRGEETMLRDPITLESNRYDCENLCE